MHRAVVILGLLAVLSGCIAEGPQIPMPSTPASTPAGPVVPPPSSVPRSTRVAPTTATPSPSGPDPTAVPQPPNAPLRRSARTDIDGVRVGIVLERNPLPAGEPTWVTTRVTNTGDDDLIWFHDGCATTIGVTGALDGVRWRHGQNQPNQMNAWKGYLLDVPGLATDGVWISFTPERFVGKGTFGCADIGREERVKPGESIQQRAQWNGLAYQGLIPPPTGPLDLVGTLRYYWRESDGAVSDIPSRTIDVRLAAWIVNEGPRLLHPHEAVDAALRDRRLTEVLASRNLRSGNEPVLRYRPTTGTYEVGVLDSGDLPEIPARVHLSVVDARTGDVVEFVDRIWDYEVDGFP